jgi:hypothetical protein
MAGQNLPDTINPDLKIKLEWFEGLTILTGPVIDQAVLHGLLKKSA